jgi:hypothetical protein
MLDYLNAHEAAFDSDEVRILAAAFDKAWDSVQGSGARFDGDGEADAARATIARHIIEAATHGELDQRRLVEGALGAFAQARWQGTPR